MIDDLAHYSKVITPLRPSVRPSVMASSSTLSVRCIDNGNNTFKQDELITEGDAGNDGREGCPHLSQIEGFA